MKRKQLEAAVETARRKAALEAWAEEKAFIAERMKHPPVENEWKWNREELYDRWEHRGGKERT